MVKSAYRKESEQRNSRWWTVATHSQSKTKNTSQLKNQAVVQRHRRLWKSCRRMKVERHQTLQLPRLSHHEIKVGIVINRRTNPRVVIEELLESYLLTIVQIHINYVALITNVSISRHYLSID